MTDPDHHDSTAVDMICRKILAYEDIGYRLSAISGSVATQSSIFGTIAGLRMALCAINGWPMEDGDVEGPADRLVRDYANQRDRAEDVLIPTGDYDSSEDTRRHAYRVAQLLAPAIDELATRAATHDASKLAEPEKPIFDRMTPLLAGTTYGGDEYRAQLAAMGPALAHHYARNPHHPEHHPDGVDGMTLIDLMEMLADWKAASERHADGDLGRSLEVNTGRFGMSAQLVAILESTARHMGWLPDTGTDKEE